MIQKDSAQQAVLTSVPVMPTAVPIPFAPHSRKKTVDILVGNATQGVPFYFFAQICRGRALTVILCGIRQNENLSSNVLTRCTYFSSDKSKGVF